MSIAGRSLAAVIVRPGSKTKFGLPSRCARDRGGRSSAYENHSRSSSRGGDRGRGPDEALRRRDGGRRPVVQRACGRGHGLPRAERRRQDDRAEGDRRARPPDRGARADQRRADRLDGAGRPAAWCLHRVVRRPSGPLGTRSPALARGAGRAARAGASTRCSRSSGSSTPPDRRVGTYSTGMRQRLGLASALLGDPEILVLDEPLNGLDPQGIRWLRTLLRERAASGGTVLLSSHVLSEVAQTVDDVVVIHRGRLVRQGAIDGARAPRRRRRVRQHPDARAARAGRARAPAGGSRSRAASAGS